MDRDARLPEHACGFSDFVMRFCLLGMVAALFATGCKPREERPPEEAQSGPPPATKSVQHGDSADGDEESPVATSVESIDLKAGAKKIPWNAVRSLGGDIDRLKRFLDRIVQESALEASERDLMIAETLRASAGDLTSEQLVGLLNEYPKGDGKGLANAYVIGYLSGAGSGRLKEYAETLPPSEYRQKAFQRLYLEDIRSGDDYRRSVQELQELPEAEDRAGALLGILQALDILISQGTMTAEFADGALTEEIPEEVRERLKSGK